MKTKTSKLIYQTAIVAVALFVGFAAGSLLFRGDGVFAEQSGSTPESGADSKVKELYDDLVTDAKGEETAGAWGDYGAIWNRIYSAAATPLVDFTNQQYSTIDDHAGAYGAGGVEDYQGEEAEWTDYTSGGDAVWKDERTGVYWTDFQVWANYDYITMATCDYYSSSARGSYAGGDEDCGEALNYCATLTFAGRDDWYVPSQKELFQAYIDGMYNQAGTTLESAAAFTMEEYWWSSSPQANSTNNIWCIRIQNGEMVATPKAGESALRCVARD